MGFFKLLCSDNLLKNSPNCNKATIIFFCFKGVLHEQANGKREALRQEEVGFS